MCPGRSEVVFGGLEPQVCDLGGCKECTGVAYILILRPDSDSA